MGEGKGRVVVVTGASSGIGKRACEELVKGGYCVYGCARRVDRLEVMAGELGENFRYFACDVGDEESVSEFGAFVRGHGRGVYALVNCAGAFGEIGRLVSSDSQAWWGSLRSNLFGTYLMIKEIYPLMGGEEGGRIINFSGGGAFNPFPNYSAYAVSKAGIVRLTETLAEELRGENIAVNGIAPGFVATEIHEATLKRGAEECGREHFEATKKKMESGGVPIEVPVECLMYLLSDRAEGLTGRTISAGFDPWREDGFVEKVMGSELYTMQRVNPR